MGEQATRRRSVPVHLIFFFSGVAGLGYEIVWTKMFAVGLGHEMPSVLAVVAAFFGGFALGAWALDGVISRSRTPGRWYVGLEVLIGAWGAATVVLVPLLNRVAADGIGIDPAPWRQGVVSFVVPFLGLLPATAAMGATLPAMERLVSRLRESGRAVAGLYAVNTAGAMAGTIVATFVVMPALGFRATLLALAVVNVACAVATAFGPAAGETERDEVEHRFADQPGPWRLGATIFATGLLGIGLEVVAIRVMTQVLENTVYTFAVALSVYLLGTAVGAALYQRFAVKPSFGPSLVWLLQLLTLAGLAAIAVLAGSSALYETCRVRFGGGAVGSVAAEVLLATLVFLPPTVLMGATFGHLAQAARGARGGIGRALGLNTLGSALAPLVFGVVLLPLIGAKWTLVIVAAGYLLLLPPRELRPYRLVPAILALPVLGLLPDTLVLVDAPAGHRIVAQREGVMAVVAVTEDTEGQRLLKVNNRFFMGGMVKSFADRRQGQLPLLLHPDPGSALFLGLGSGLTLGAATWHDGLRPTGVELVPEVVELLPWFEPHNRLDALERDRDLVVADARRFVRATDERYDVIVADLFHPGRDGAGALYTREHFEAVRERLAAGGLFCQWLPLYQLDLPTIRLVIRTFLAVFPAARGYIAHFNPNTPMLGLVGRLAPVSFPADWYQERLAGHPALASELERVALGSGLTLFGCLLADNEDLRRTAGTGPLNTDDHPRVIFRAPRFTYRKTASAHGRLETLLDVWSPTASALIAGDGEDAEAFRLRLDDYLAARDLYLRGTFRLATGQQAEGLERCLESVRRSADFRTAYVAVLQQALALSRSDRALARRTLLALRDANPADPRAGRYLQQLGE